MRVEIYSVKRLLGARRWYWLIRGVDGEIAARGGRGHRSRSAMMLEMRRAGDAIISNRRS